MRNQVYQVITERVIALLKQGVVPWHQPWHGAEQAPQNLVTQRPYRGVNVFLLNSMAFTSPYWLTFRQAKELGGHVRQGERACPVVFWKWLEVETDDAEQGQTGKKTVPFLRYYSVFNVAQCEDIAALVPPVPTHTVQPIEAATQIVANMPQRPEIHHGGARACYWPSLDRVDMPELATFDRAEDYHSVLYHELTHSTGHDSRLARQGIVEGAAPFGSHTYSKEELVAEMGAAFLSGQAGIVERTLDNSTAYIGSWLARLHDDAKLVVLAAAQAQKAADFILNRQPVQDPDVA